MMRRATIPVLSFLLLTVLACCAQATRVSPDVVTGESLIKLLPRSATFVFAMDVKRFMGIDAVVRTMQDPKFKEEYDNFVKVSGIDPKEDVDFMGFGIDVSELIPSFMGTGKTAAKNICFILTMKYDKTRFKDLIKKNNPAAKEEKYDGVPIFSNLGSTKDPKPQGMLAAPLLALLDSSHIVFGDEPGVKSVIDVRRKKAEPLARNPEMMALIGRVDRSGLAWSAMYFPDEFIKKLVSANPQFKAMGERRRWAAAIDDKNATLVVDAQIIGGTMEQNAAEAASLNSIKTMMAMNTGLKPGVAELLKGISVASGNDYIRLTLTVSHETLGKLFAKPKKDEPEAER